MDAWYVRERASEVRSASQTRGGRWRRVRRAALVLATLTVATLSLAASAEAFVYWADADDNAIARANLDGTGADLGFITGANSPTGVAVDSAHIYWITPMGIGRANLDGTGVNPSFITAPVGRAGIAIDDAHVYWVSKHADPAPSGSLLIGAPGTGAIGRANLDGTGVTLNFIGGISFPSSGLAVDGSHLYWGSFSPDTTRWLGPPVPQPFPTRIGRANLNGTGVDENFIFDTPSGLAVDDAHVWWTVSTPAGTGPTPSAAAALIGGISRANLDGTGSESVVDPAEKFSETFSTCGIAVNDTHVYWTEIESVGRARLDGSRATHELVAHGSSCAGVALDALGPPPSNDFSLGRAKRDEAHGSAKLTVKVPGPGKLSLAKSALVKGASIWAEHSGKATLAVRPKGAAKERLQESGETKVTAKVTYAPDGGDAASDREKIKLVRR